MKLALFILSTVLFSGSALPANAEVGLGLDKFIFDIEALPGSAHIDMLKVSNKSREMPLPVRIGLNLWNLKEESDDFEFVTSEPELNAVKWFKLEQADFILAPLERRDIGFSVAPPKSAPPGTYLVMMRFQAVLPEHYFAAGGPKLVPEVGAMFFLKIPQLAIDDAGDSYKAELVSFGVISKNQQSRHLNDLLVPKANAGVFEDAVEKVVAKVMNGGIYHFKASGYLEIRNWYGGTVAKVDLPARYLLPNRARSLEVKILPDIGGNPTILERIAHAIKTDTYVGPYTATLHLDLPKGNPVIRTIGFWVIPWKIWLGFALPVAILMFLVLRLRSRLALAVKVIWKGV